MPYVLLVTCVLGFGVYCVLCFQVFVVSQVCFVTDD